MTTGSVRSPKFGRQLTEAREPLPPQLSVLHSRLHRAARLGVVSAIVEAAAVGERRDIVEGLTDSVLGRPESDVAHPGGVDQQPAAREGDELTVGGRVPSPTIAALLPRP